MNKIKGTLTGELEIKVLKIRRSFFGSTKVLIRDPEGNEVWVYEDDILKLTVTIRID